MTLHLSRSTKLMSFGIVLSLGWFLFESCDCDETKEDQYPGFWVTCIDNKPTLMTYSGNSATVIASDAAGAFNPGDWDCSHDANSPSYKGSEDSPPFRTSTPSGPGGPGAIKGHATAFTVHLPELRDLPFIPDIPPSAAAPVCQSSFPDVFATNQLNAVVTRITTCPFAIKAVIPVVDAPLQVAITPDGSTALVTSFNNAVSFIDLATNKVTYTLLTDSNINPHGLAISPDGKRAYVTSFNSSNAVVIVIDLTSPTKSIIATIPTITFPQGATLTPDGSQLWITSPLATGVDVIDTLTNTHATALAINQSIDVAFNSTGTRAYVTSQSTNPGQVYAVNTGTYQIITTYTVGLGPTDIKMSYGNEFLIVNNNGESSISIIDLKQKAVKTAQVGANPTGISFMR